MRKKKERKRSNRSFRNYGAVDGTGFCEGVSEVAGHLLLLFLAWDGVGGQAERGGGEGIFELIEQAVSLCVFQRERTHVRGRHPAPGREKRADEGVK